MELKWTLIAKSSVQGLVIFDRRCSPIGSDYWQQLHLGVEWPYFSITFLFVTSIAWISEPSELSVRNFFNMNHTPKYQQGKKKIYIYIYICVWLSEKKKINNYIKLNIGKIPTFWFCCCTVTRFDCDNLCFFIFCK